MKFRYGLGSVQIFNAILQSRFKPQLNFIKFFAVSTLEYSMGYLNFIRLL